MHLVIVPVSRFRFITNANSELISINQAVEAARKIDDVYVLLSKNSFKLIQKLQPKPIKIFTEYVFERYKKNLNLISSGIATRKIPTFKVDEKLLTTISFHTKPTHHPVIRSMGWFKPYCYTERAQLLYEIIDPRFYHPTGKISRSCISNILRHCGLTYHVFSDWDKKVLDRPTSPSTRRAILAWISWYSVGFSDKRPISQIVPDPKAKYGLRDPRSYFIRQYCNKAKCKWDPTVLFKVTKEFITIFVRVWGHWLGVYNFDPYSFFRYKCEADGFIQKQHEVMNEQDSNNPNGRTAN